MADNRGINRVADDRIINGGYQESFGVFGINNLKMQTKAEKHSW